MPFMKKNEISAGTIVVSGGIDTVTLTPAADGTYAAVNVQKKRLFAGGETLRVVASGDAAGVPAFSAQVTAPPRDLLVQSPATASVAVDRSRDLSVSWQSRAGATISLYLSDATSEHEVSCQFPSEQGTASIPASLLGGLTPSMGRMDVVVSGDAEVPAGDRKVEVQAMTHAQMSDGTLAIYGLQLQ
jgi:hypothetical protein